MTPDPFGRAVWFTEGMFSHIMERAIQGDGTLGPLGPNQFYSSTVAPNAFAVDPTGTYAYSGAPGSISRFDIGAEDGALTLAPNYLSTSWVNPIAMSIALSP